jgi:hypothetical protein
MVVIPYRRESAVRNLLFMINAKSLHIRGGFSLLKP